MRASAAGESGRLVLLVALGLHLALASWLLASRHYWPRFDSGVFISAATAASRGVGLRDITAPVTRPAESWVAIPAWVRGSEALMDRPDWPVFIHYPPLLPAALAPLVHLGQGRFLVLQLLPLAAGAAALVLVYRWRQSLFPGPWPLTLLVCAGSLLTVYATRVQSEVFHLVLALAAARLLARAVDEPERLALRAGLAALVLALAGAVHVRLVFFAAGAAVWLLVFFKGAPLRRRVLPSAAIVALAVVPPLVFTFEVSWAGREGLPRGGARYGLANNPYYWTDGWNPRGTRIGEGDTWATLSQRAQAAGTLVWYGITNGEWRPRPDRLALLGLGAVALLAWPWWRHRAGLLALPTLAYLGAVALSPWTETRMIVPVLPFLAHAVSVSVARLPALVRATGPRWERMALLAAGTWILATQGTNWLGLTPDRDPYALEFRGNLAYLVTAHALRSVPAELPVIGPHDNSAFALVTGRATLSLSPAEWKQCDPSVWLGSGGAAVAVGPVVPAGRFGPVPALTPELASLAPPTVRQEARLGASGLALEWVRAVPVEVTETARWPAYVPGRIHPRWLAVGPEDRDRLARAARPRIEGTP